MKKRTLLAFFGLILCLALTSSTTRQPEVLGNCPGPYMVWLVESGGNHPLYPGENELFPSTTYYVHVEGGDNSMIVCITGGAGYTINGTGCTDLGDGYEGIPGTITTNSSISSGVTLGIGVTCTPGNGQWTGDYYYDGAY